MELAISIAVNVLLGLLLLALLSRWGRRDNARLTGPEDAMTAFRVHFPDASGTATVAADGRSALVDLAPETGVGLLQRHGRRWNARILAPREIASVQVGGDGAIDVRFADFAWPRAAIRIEDGPVRAAWISRLDALKEQGQPHPPADLRHA